MHIANTETWTFLKYRSRIILDFFGKIREKFANRKKTKHMRELFD